MLKKNTIENINYLYPVLKPIQQPVFKLNKKQCTYLLNENPLLTLDEINKRHKKGEKLPNVVVDTNYDTEYLTPHIIDMSEVLLSKSIKAKSKTRNDIEKLTITNEEIEKYQNERTFKQVVTCQIKGYNPDDTTYIYVHSDQLEYMNNNNVKHTINQDGMKKLPNYPRRGLFD